MAFSPTTINFNLTEHGFNRIMERGGKPIEITYLAIGKGNENNDDGYATKFRDQRTSLEHEVVRKKLLSSQTRTYTDENNNELGSFDFATIFDGNFDFNVWEMGALDENGIMVYVWSQLRYLSNDSGKHVGSFAPKRPNIDLVVSISQDLLFREESENITIVDAGLPFELFLQPLKDDIEKKQVNQLVAILKSVTRLSISLIDADMRAKNINDRISRELDRQNEFNVSVHNAILRLSILQTNRELIDG